MLPYILVIFLLFLIFILLFYSNSSKKHQEEEITESLPVGKPCPICQWPLQKNERVHSIRYNSKSDDIMHIFGCPYCYREHPKPKFQPESIRTCPACKKRLSDKEYVIARLFEKPGKNHVHVLGCYRCRGKR
ncbi:MAG: hypothetical protein OCD02_15830 [Spirochaetaceae bacterium]